MSITVNGQVESLPEPRTLGALLSRLAPQVPFAVACNGDFVPRDAYAECGLKAGDRIEIVHPAAGG